MRSCTWINTFAIVCIAGFATACQERSAGAGGWGYSQPQPNAALQALIDGKTLPSVVSGPQMSAAEKTRLTDQVRRVYKDQNYQLIWIDGDRPSGRYHELAKALDAAGDHGLPRELYAAPIEGPSGSQTKISPEQAPQLDTKITASFLRYFAHLSGGRLDPRELQSMWTLKPEKPDLAAALSQAVKNNDLGAAMERLQPRQPDNTASSKKPSCGTVRSPQKGAGLLFPPARGSSPINNPLRYRHCGGDWPSRETSIRRMKTTRVLSSMETSSRP